MGKINIGRVVMGGLVAGLIINIAEMTSQVVFADWYAEFFESLNLPEMGGGDMAALVIGGFVIGIVIAWTYAAMRPRFGPGSTVRPPAVACGGPLTARSRPRRP